MAFLQNRMDESGLTRWWSGLSPNFRGAVFMLGAVWGFTGTAVLVRILGDSGVGAFQTAFARGLIGTLVLLPFVMQAGGLRALRTAYPVVHTARVIAGAGGMTLAYYAFTALPLAEVMALSFTVPLFTTLLALFFLSETVGWRRIAATAVGFLGVLVVLRPAALVGLGDPLPLLPILCMLAMAFGLAFAVAAIKTLPKTETQLMMLFYWLVGTMGLAGPAAYAGWTWPNATQMLLLLGVGVLSLGFQWLIITAFRNADASFLAPIDYTKLIFAILLGWTIFGEVPDGWTLIGAGVIILSTLYIAHRERARAQTQLAATRPAPSMR